ncbi:MAG TPA: prenyltransferase/squalene oxidase repeat-containing protein [Tepidisphaeraceae bacterium]|nr:prenyltransferase/squalene oxidase repeat-containing protein [Tepidisphaeraceae bacterium]
MWHHSKFIAVCVLLIGSIVNAQNSPDQRAEALIDKGLDYLKTQQKSDGGWANPHEPPGFTALALRAIVLDPKYSADTDFVKRGYDKLLSYQQSDGGIYEDSLANYNTAIAISALAAANDAKFKPNIEKAVAYLKSLQWMDMAGVDPQFKYQGEKDAWYGGWGYSGKTHSRGRPDLSNTQMAIDALHDAGVSPDDPSFKAALKFVGRLQNSSETNDQSWAGNDGGFVYSPGDDRKGSSAAGDFTSPEGDRRLRSYGSMTYAGLKSFIYAGLSKSDPRVRAAWDWITKNWTLSENPGMRLGKPENAQQGLYYYYHTLSRALGAYAQANIDDPQGAAHDWRIELIDKLASLQKPDGSWAGEKRWMEDNPVLVTSYCVLALEEARKDLKEHPGK